MEMFELDHYYVLISFITYTLSSIPVVWQQSIGERERERGGGIFIGIKRKNAKKVSYPCFSMYNMIFFFQSPCCKLRIMDKILF